MGLSEGTKCVLKKLRLNAKFNFKFETETVIARGVTKIILIHQMTNCVVLRCYGYSFICIGIYLFVCDLLIGLH